ncbi:MAG: SCP2 sterol-binding domain-containing protein [Eubacteriales bacterium]|nr:SCP2 sterol-binding domain-containing protein [Eubacteriales bacterium]
MTDTFRRDIEAMYAYARQCERLDTLVPALYEVFRRNGDSLAGITASYRLTATDTGYAGAFALTQGRFAELSPSAPTDVTISGREPHLLAVFQRRVSPAAAMLTRKIKVDGSKTALLKLAEFL